MSREHLALIRYKQNTGRQQEKAAHRVGMTEGMKAPTPTHIAVMLIIASFQNVFLCVTKHSWKLFVSH